MEIHGAFRFHSVGQGLFYSGLLNKKDGKRQKVFSFVYDCGTASAKRFLEEEIADYKLLLPTANRQKTLDLLVVSHLHDDHISGLESLLQDVEVGTVVMPYVNDGMKLLAQLESDGSTEFLRTFYADPVAWFVSKGVRRILLLGSEEADDHLNAPESGARAELESDDFYVDGGILRLERDKKTTIAYLRNKAALRAASFGWTFVFENLPGASGRAERYREIVAEFQEEKLAALDGILKSRRLSNELKRRLKHVFEGEDAINRTSVLLLHGPKEMSGERYVSLAAGSWHSSFFDCCGTLLTGDISLKGGEQLEMLSPADPGCCLILQYPHHGAGNHNTIHYFRGLKPTICLISYGLTNRYGHPDNDVLRSFSPNVLGVNERSAFDYQIYLE